MAKITRDQAVSALVAAVCEALEHGEEAYVPGLGTFRVEYKPSATETLPTGDVVMRPPRNAIVFAPHEEEASPAAL
jgi:nucleoid DNA-binding protein